MSDKPPISCYIRTLNEERMIGKVVNAALEVAEEVVLVDCGSTDRTIEIAEIAGARVVHQDWLGNGYQKRAGEDACRNDWLLDLDADEVVSEELAAEIRALFVAGEPSRPVYRLRLITVPPHGPVWHKSSVALRAKLYDRRRLRMPEHKAWDQLDIPASMTVGKLAGELWHYSFNELSQLVAKLNRVSSVRARELKLKSKGVLALRILFGIPVYFLKHYVTRGLWRLGLYGFSVSMISAFGRWLRDVKMLERHLPPRQD